jgi:hypothetical protein
MTVNENQFLNGIRQPADPSLMTPLEKVEALYEELVRWYGEGEHRETRAASKLLMVALVKLKEHNGPGWQWLVHDYLHIINDDPERYARIIEANRGERKGEGGDVPPIIQ